MQTEPLLLELGPSTINERRLLSSTLHTIAQTPVDVILVAATGTWRISLPSGIVALRKATMALISDESTYRLARS
jgi:hypothetical protein